MEKTFSNDLTLQPGLTRPWTVYLIHHSHTDIGYTETQRRIQSRHRDFVEQALQTIKADSDGGFVWNNECHWALEGWWRAAAPERRQELAAAVRAGRFGLSGTYAHFTELVDDFVLRQMLGRASALAKEIGGPNDSAISADINGFGWGYSQALHDHGVRNLIVFLHPHHGLTPLNRRQLPFWWETPKGDRLLVWLGEHYNLGNVLGLCPRAHLTHGLKDEWTPKQLSEDHGLIAATRLPRYLRQLELDGYPQNFVTMGISGTMSDNAPPNGEIARFAREWNAKHGDRICIKMTTPNRYAALVREKFAEIPVHRGDWPDWWSDGYASQPFEVRLCRQAQREYAKARSLAEHLKFALPPAACAQAEQGIALYTEHTFGHSDSLMTPWDGSVKMVGGMKRCFAYEAAAAAEELSDAVDARLGAAPLAPDRPFFFRAVNPTDQSVRDCVMLYLEGSDFGTRDLGCTIVDCATGTVHPCQKLTGPRGMAWGVWLELKPFEARDFELCEGLLTLSSTERCCTDFTYWGFNAMPDMIGGEPAPALRVTTDFLETPHVRIAWEKGGEITSWINKTTGESLLAADRVHGPLTPVYERTPVQPPNNTDAQMRTRGRIGRNRKGADVVRTAGRIVAVEALAAGPLAAMVQIDYELPGCTLARLVLTAWKDAPRVDISFRVNKDSVWDPESLYLSLPFSPGAAKPELWLDKAGARVRPGVDQLPDSLTDFYTVQEGFAVVGNKTGIAVACPDAPLLQLGALEHGPRLLMGAPELADRPLRPYGWLMTNYWETNFEASLGGFHEFRYRLEWGAHIQTQMRGLDLCRALNHGLKCFRSGAEAAPLKTKK
jgi:hypothetical protein